jgi:hypothetical protein
MEIKNYFVAISPTKRHFGGEEQLVIQSEELWVCLQTLEGREEAVRRLRLVSTATTALSSNIALCAQAMVMRFSRRKCKRLTKTQKNVMFY